MPNGRAIAKTFLVDKSSKYTLNQRIAGITPHSNINPKFLSITMNRNKYFLQFDDGVKQTNLSLNDMKKFEELYPNKQEQDKIGELFTNLDNLITLHQRKFNYILSHKLEIKLFFFKITKNVWEQRKFENIYNYERPDKYIVNSTEYLEFGPTPVLTANKAFILGYTTENNKYVNSNESIIFDDFTLDTKFVDFPYMVKSSAIKILTLKDEKKDNIRFNFELLSNHRFNMLGHARHYISVVQPEEVFTTNKHEQDKIGELFTNLDNLITLHQRKCTYIFYSWEQRKFGNCVLIQRGGSPRPIESYLTSDDVNGVSWIKIGDVKTGERYITKTAEKIIPEGIKNSREVFPGDLILSNSMSFGRPYIMGIYGCIHDGWLVIKDINNLFDKEYLLQLLSSEYMYNQYKQLASGGVVNNLNSELVQNTKVLITNIEEQKKLGDIFKNLDNLITLHQRKLEKLNNIKKSMLDKMFV